MKSIYTQTEQTMTDTQRELVKSSAFGRVTLKDFDIIVTDGDVPTVSITKNARVFVYLNKNKIWVKNSKTDRGVASFVKLNGFLEAEVTQNTATTEIAFDRDLFYFIRMNIPTLEGIVWNKVNKLKEFYNSDKFTGTKEDSDAICAKLDKIATAFISQHVAIFADPAVDNAHLNGALFDPNDWTMTNDAIVEALDKIAAEALARIKPAEPSETNNEYIVYNDSREEMENMSPNELQKIISVINSTTSPVSYVHPKNMRCSTEIPRMVLSEFFAKDDAELVAQYMGAIVSNASIKDVQKIMIVHGNSGQGKSVLFKQCLLPMMLPRDFFIRFEFDKAFSTDYTFASECIRNVRALISDEASFGGDLHNFANINTSAIKTYVTEGEFRKERKFKSALDMELNALMIILSNHHPDLKYTDDPGMNRRLLEVSLLDNEFYEVITRVANLDPTLDKTEKVRMFKAFMFEHREEFIKYFYDAYTSNRGNLASLEGMMTRKQTPKVVNLLNDYADDLNLDITNLSQKITDALHGVKSEFAVVRNDNMALYIVTVKAVVSKLSEDEQKFIQQLPDMQALTFSNKRVSHLIKRGSKTQALMLDISTIKDNEDD